MELEIIKKTDPLIADAISKELERQAGTLELIASENIASPAVIAAQGTVLTNKYAEGYPGKRYYGGCEHVDIAENLAVERAKNLFQAEYVNVQPHSGSQANMAVYFALLEPGDVILGMHLDQGGHLSHGKKINFSGRLFSFFHYGLNRDTETIDYEELARLAEEKRPGMIVAGASAYPRIIDFKRFSEIAESVGAILMVDMAHIAGLVAADLHPTPVPYAQIVTSTTHKTLRGPRGGLILARKEYGEQLDKSIFPGIQGGPLMHVIAAKAVAFKEAESNAFRSYQQDVVDNAKELADRLMDNGIRLVSGGTDNHMMLVDLRNIGITGKKAEEVLGLAGITVNKNAVPFDPEKPTITSGIRIGSPAITTRGMKKPEMGIIAGYIAEVLKHSDDDSLVRSIREKILELCGRFPIYM